MTLPLFYNLMGILLFYSFACVEGRIMDHFPRFDKAETLPFLDTTFQDYRFALGPVTLGVV